MAGESFSGGDAIASGELEDDAPGVLAGGEPVVLYAEGWDAEDWDPKGWRIGSGACGVRSCEDEIF